MIDNIKDEIILAVFNYLEDNSPRNRDRAIDLIQKFAKKYTIKIKKANRLRINSKDAFRRFVSNEKGYIETIPILYNSL